MVVELSMSSSYPYKNYSKILIVQREFEAQSDKFETGKPSIVMENVLFDNCKPSCSSFEAH